MLSSLRSSQNPRTTDPSEPTGLRKDVASLTGRRPGLIAPRHTNTPPLRHLGAPVALEPLAAPEAGLNHPQHHLDVAEEAAAEVGDEPGAQRLVPDDPEETLPAITVSPTTHVTRLQTRWSGRGPPTGQSSEGQESTRSMRQCRYCYKCFTKCMCSSFYESSRNKECVTYKRALFAKHVGKRYLDDATVGERLHYKQREPCQNFSSLSPRQLAIVRNESPGSQNDRLRVQAVNCNTTTSVLENDFLQHSGLSSGECAGRDYISSRQGRHTAGPQTPGYDRVPTQVIPSKEKGGGVYVPFWTKGPSFST